MNYGFKLGPFPWEHSVYPEIWHNFVFIGIALLTVYLFTKWGME